MMMRFGDGGMGLGVFLYILVWAAFVVLVFAVLIGIVRWLWRSGGPANRSGGAGTGWSGPSGSPDEPLDILRQRYARGEIDDEEYERRRRILTG